jgi:hypothetical protein
MADGTYTQEGIMAQIWVAFGQGSGAIRVSHAAAAALKELYFDAIKPEIVSTHWSTQGYQVLERIRVLGRMAALNATQRGDSTVSPEDIQASAPKVHTTSDTDFCPPPKS